MTKNTGPNDLHTEGVFDPAHRIIIDPMTTKNFMAAWEVYIEHRLKKDDAKSLASLHDQSIHAHFNQGMTILDRVSHMDPSTVTLQSIVDGETGISAIFDRAGRIVMHNQPLDVISPEVNSFSQLPIDEDAKSQILRWAGSHHNGRTDFLFSRCAIGDEARSSCMLTVSLDAGFSAGSDEDQLYFISSIDLRLDVRAQAVLQEQFEFSQAEVDIALKLTEGLTPAEISAARGVTINTVRTQIKSVQSKSATRSAPELVRFLSRFAATYATDENLHTILRDTFDFSEAEIAVALKLIAGATPSDISTARGVTLHTVRSQIRAVLAKTQTRSIPDLVRFFSGIAVGQNRAVKPAGKSGPPRMRPKVLTNPNCRTGQITLSDGRTLAYLDQGDRHGIPVLFFHSIVCGGKLTDTAISECVEAGYRIIAPVMPGYGASSAHADLGGLDLIEGNARDARELLQALEIEQVLVMGHVVGTISAQGFAVQFPQMVRGLMFIGHATHFDERFYDDLPPALRFLTKTMARLPKLLPLIVKTHIGMLDTDDEEKLIKLIHNPGPIDQIALHRPDIFSVVIEGTRQCLLQGSDSYAQYYALSMQDWLPFAKQVSAPVCIMHGMQDTIIGLHHIEPYLALKPETKLVQIEDAGRYLPFSHWPQVLEQLIALGAKTSKSER